MRILLACLLIILIGNLVSQRFVYAQESFVPVQVSEGQKNGALLNIVPIRILPNDPFYFIISIIRAILTEFHEMLKKDRPPLVNTRPPVILEQGLQAALNNFSLITHGFGSPCMLGIVKTLIITISEMSKYMDKEDNISTVSSSNATVPNNNNHVTNSVVGSSSANDASVTNHVNGLGGIHHNHNSATRHHDSNNNHHNLNMQHHQLNSCETMAAVSSLLMNHHSNNSINNTYHSNATHLNNNNIFDHLQK